MRDDVLKLDGLSAGYGKVLVLRDISFRVSEGSVVGIIGPNGHGKTTLLNTICGFVSASSGTIELDGGHLTGLAPHQVAARGVVHIPQGDLIFPDLSIYENLLMGAYLEPDGAVQARRLASVFAMFPKLEERQAQMASTLSGGERRMLGIGRGLMRESRIMLIDEPSLGLAPIVVEQIYDTLKELKSQGRTIVLVEENPSRVVDFADEIFLIDNGEIVWSGQASEMEENENILETYLGG
ncbi:ABC transporter ATP-binding protein [Ferruginivarius sediminum]|uniref:ABC transporter ATP-binding protein n=1 Tax=Ferruginivarius sediminum TaxID=2661937 RepID=A0A369T7M3_9PROT|nr:ABC transporter ATP-binding protein [Ferruginivarius sediminum]RDD60177.1 ABC transporter ATP-binding protein [Ferruginivarius sediminum]